MIIDCHGHFTTVPASFRDWRAKQVESANDPANAPPLDGRSCQRRRDPRSDRQWPVQAAERARRRPDAVLADRRPDEPPPRQRAHQPRMGRGLERPRVPRDANIYPDNFAPVCQLPQSPGVPPANSVAELRRCVEEMGFVGCNLNPDPSGGYWTGKPMTDREWYPLYEALCDLDVPAMIHVAASCNPCFHGTGAHYLNADTSVFMQLLQGNVFKDFPTLRLVIPHGGGAVPYHWGRYRGMSLEMMRPSARRAAEQHLLRHLRLSPPRRRVADQGRCRPTTCCSARK